MTRKFEFSIRSYRISSANAPLYIALSHFCYKSGGSLLIPISVRVDRFRFAGPQSLLGRRVISQHRQSEYLHTNVIMRVVRKRKRQSTTAAQITRGAGERERERGGEKEEREREREGGGKGGLLLKQTTKEGRGKWITSLWIIKHPAPVCSLCLVINSNDLAGVFVVVVWVGVAWSTHYFSNLPTALQPPPFLSFNAVPLFFLLFYFCLSRSCVYMYIPVCFPPPPPPTIFSVPSHKRGLRLSVYSPSWQG